MNRPYDNLKIKKLIKNCKLKIKNLSLGTDIIVAFPGETESDFKETLSLCKNIGFQKIHTFRSFLKKLLKSQNLTYLHEPN